MKNKKLFVVEVDFLPVCDFCKQEGNEIPAEFDAKTTFGPWAYMCKKHFFNYGVGLGPGKGQRLIVKKKK